MLRFTVIIFCLLMIKAVAAATSVAQLQELITQKRFVDAAATGEQLLGQNPLQPQARFLTAYAHQMSSQTDRAVSLYQGLIEDCKLTGVHVTLVRLFPIL
jgi:hypothetical protein